VTCPVLPELITEGDTVAEAPASIEDAVTALIEAYEDLGRPLPPILRQTAFELDGEALAADLGGGQDHAVLVGDTDHDDLGAGAGDAGGLVGGLGSAGGLEGESLVVKSS
jgi:predicted RNase H-like HicB family nuclease